MIIQHYRVARLTGLSPHQAITVYGFRAAFRKFTIEGTRFSEDLIEEALAHKIVEATGEAYRRSARRLHGTRLMMNLWADFCTGAITLDQIDQNSRKAGEASWP